MVEGVEFWDCGSGLPADRPGGYLASQHVVWLRDCMKRTDEAPYKRTSYVTYLGQIRIEIRLLRKGYVRLYVV